MSLQVIILAAGKGKRMVSTKPKVLHKLGGIPLIEHVINTAATLNPANIYVVYGNGGKTLPEKMKHLNVKWVHQDEQLGTGHAVMQAIPQCKDNDQVLVLYGDVPCIPTSVLELLLRDTPKKGVGLVVTELKDPTGFGRIIRSEVGNILAIVEHKDASAKQRKIKEINTGIICTNARNLKEWLPKLQKNNKQQEYYLTDIIALANDEGIPVGGVIEHNPDEVLGVNDRWQLTNLERHYQLKLARRIALSGVTILDPNRLDIRGNVEVGAETIIDVNVILEGNVSIGSNCNIGPNVYLKDVKIGDNVSILSNSVIEGANIASEAHIGPFARVRSGTVIEQQAKVGNFVEVKKTILGKGSKASHLTYLGDAIIGEQVNIGAGTITCNYDGVNKHQTTIEDGAFIGSNSALVAPVVIGKGAFIGAGSTIYKDAARGKLTVARARQATVKSWERPVKESVDIE